MEKAAPDALARLFAPKEISQMGWCLEEAIRSWESFLPGDITTCLCDDGWIKCSRKWLTQDREAVFVRVQSCWVRGEGSGVFPCRHQPHEEAGAVGSIL